MDQINELLVLFFKSHMSSESFQLSKTAKQHVMDWIIDMEQGKLTYLGLEAKLGLIPDKNVCFELDRFILAGYSFRTSSK